ncbi:sulfite exporter TauE/SafE family protein [uncultured Thiodictyon sp.]|uniref:sulfite exporter TauE/SafE family protein n=1 Tax=uncultured Thiodictyon sp. TaxID=1846217 RepID=UPI0025E23EC8|nr:sulfite exporter TauE/SafE family protein [uncultured Thiodictyon sp.]
MPLLDLLGFLLTGILSGVLAGLFGVGGGAVMVPALIFLFGHLGLGGAWVSHLAIGTSLATIVGTGAASTLAHHRRGGVRWDLVAGLAPGIVFGAWAGAVVAGVLPELWLKRLFAVFLTYVGVRMLIPGRTAAPRALPGRAGLWAVGGGIGTLSALVGIGGGTLTVPFLARCGLDLRHAVGTSAACGLPIAIAGAIGFMVVGWGRTGLPGASTGFVYWPAVVLMLLASIPTAPLGARLAHTLPVALLKRTFGVFLLLIAARLAFG